MHLLDFLFKKKSSDVHPPSPNYALVEMEIDKDTFQQGIRLLDPKYRNIVVTVDPRVRVEPKDDHLHIIFDFKVVTNPDNIDYVHSELHPVVGDIIVDMMRKDYM